VNTHPGSHKGAGELLGLKACVQSLTEIFERTSNFKTKVLLEMTAGQGNDLGARFEQIAFLLEHTPHNKRLGVCVDTCHIFAAGYDFITDKSYTKMWKDFDKIIGLEWLQAFHLNDSKFPLGSHRDRHAEIGKGEIGAETFRKLVNDPRFKNHPGVTELEEDVTLSSLDTLRSLRD
jgi:deoxyribonuclease-4